MINCKLAAQPEADRDPFVSRGDQVRLLAGDKDKEEDIAVLPYPVAVSGIIWAEKKSIAIINGDLVQEGEVWRDFKVEKIEKNKVVLARRKARFEITLISENENIPQKQ